MNGRVYDPYGARFLSADPFIQDVSNLQGYNRYSYVYNNPLALTDPTGYFSLSKFFKNVVRPVAAAVIGYYTGNFFYSFGDSYGLSMVASKALAGAAGGFSAGAVASGGHIKSALQGAFSGAVFGAIGGFGKVGGWETTDFVVAHSAGGCVTSAASGGDCASGALAAGFAKYTTLAIDAKFSGEGFRENVLNGVATVVAGGTASVLGGGKFENGATTAAYAFLYNYCSSGKCTDSIEQFMYDWWPGYKAGTLLYNQTMGDGGWTGWEVLDAASTGLGLVGRGVQLFGTIGREIQLVDGFYEANGLKISKYYYEKLWATGRGAPFLQAQEVLNTATSVTPDRMAGFYRYTNSAMEMVYNPKTREVWHLLPLKK